MLRAIYCDSSSILISNGDGSNFVENSSSESFLNSFEFNLLPPEELEKAEELEKTEEISVGKSKESKEFEEEDEDIVVAVSANLNTKRFDTSIENLGLTQSEEALISEAMRNPIHVPL